MPSPLPGMNPYFERPGIWPEFHTTYLVRLRADLSRLVVPRYAVRIGERVYLREQPDAAGVLAGLPDLSVTTRAPAAGGAAVATAGPAVVTLRPPNPVEERVRFLEVFDLQRERVVTVLELLSPANKYAGPDRDQYLVKRHRLLTAGASVVELDLLRGGPRATPDLPACDYYALVARATAWPRAEVWPVRLREPLPPIPVPLRPGEAEPTLDLQAALHAVYDDGGYSHFLYRGDPDPPLAPADAAWARTLLPPA